MTAQQVAAIPRAQKSMFDARHARSVPQLSPRQWKAITTVVFVVVGLLISAVLRC
jgi:hypothetical protein